MNDHYKEYSITYGTQKSSLGVDFKLLVAASTGQKKNRASVYPIFFDNGSIRTFKFPPNMFMKNRKNPRTEVLTPLGNISTIVMKRMPNHVSAEIARVG